MFKEPFIRRYAALTLVAAMPLLFSCSKKEELSATAQKETKKEANTSTTFKPDADIQEMIDQMSLAEKVGQMMQINITKIMTDSSATNFDDQIPMDIDMARSDSLFKKYMPGSILNGKSVSPEEWASVLKTIQESNMRYSPNKIPIIYGVDHVHGTTYIEGGTIFPHNINIGGTFDTMFATQAGAVTATESADLYHRWIFSPVLDLGRNKSWSRYYETYGEDPLVVSKMGAAYIRALQGGPNEGEGLGIAACAKHFIGYSDSKSGWDRTPIEMSPQVLQEMYRPPFQAAIDAGVRTFMINSGEINGVPVHASKELLIDLLRHKMGFTGVVVTDWLDIISLWKAHHVADNEKEAVKIAIMAGIDMSMTPSTTDFADYLIELVNEGEVPESRINEAVGRILMLKKEIGLFKNPYPRTDRFDRIGTEESHKMSLRAATESIVLLRNEKDLLPLAANKKILLTGLNADSKRGLCGGWTYRWMAWSDQFFPKEMETVYTALQKEFSSVSLAKDAGQVAAKGRSADVIIVATGENPYSEGFGNIQDMSLPEAEMNLVTAALKTGKPVIVMMVAGRPRTLGSTYMKLDGFVWAGLPGTEGGTAIAQLLSGKENFSGKLPFTYPYKPQRQTTYNHKATEFTYMHYRSKELTRSWVALFGEGESYTKFAYSNLTISDTLLNKKGSLTASVTVKNIGERAGKEAVLWFVSDKVAKKFTRPVRELQHFEKQLLAPGDSATFSFTIRPETHLWYPDEKGNKILEDGYFEVQVDTLKQTFYLEK